MYIYIYTYVHIYIYRNEAEGVVGAILWELWVVILCKT